MQPLSHRYAFIPHPLALLAAAFATGVLVARLLPIPIGTLTALMALSAASIIWSLRKQLLGVASCLVVLSVLVAGAALEAVEKRRGAPDHIKTMLESGTIAPNDPVELTGVLQQPPESAPASFYLTLRVEKLRFKGLDRNVCGTVQLLAPVHKQMHRDEFDALNLRYGARVRVMTALERSDNYRNPGVSSFTEYLDRKGEDATGVIKSPLLVERLDDTRVFPLLQWIYQWRSKLEREIRNKFPPETAGVLDAAFLGNRYFLSHQAAERFRDGGTFHVLVISGLQISVIGGVVFLIVRRLTKRRCWRFVWSSFFLWAYAVAVGAEASVIRAALMFTLVAFAPVVWRQARSLNALGGAALLLLVWHPDELFDPSFQLTFLSVLAIVVIGAPLVQRLFDIGGWQPSQETPYPPDCPRWLRSFCEALCWSQRKWEEEIAGLTYSYGIQKTPWARRLERNHLQRLLRYVVGAAIVSASVQLAMLPLMILYFHRLCPASLILNIIVSVFMALLGVGALVSLLVSQISMSLAIPVIGLTNSLNWLMIHSVDPFARAGIASIRLPEYSGWAASIYFLYFVPLALLAYSLWHWNPLNLRNKRCNVRRGTNAVLAVVQLVFVIVLVLHPLSGTRIDDRLRVDFLDVGQGDSALVTLPDGTTLLVDGGGRPNFRDRKQTVDSDSDEAELPFERDTRSIGEAVVSEYLWWRGLDRVDYIIATHADADHIDGLNDVVRNFRVHGALVARTPAADPEYAKFADTLRLSNVPLSMIGRGDQLRFSGVTIRVIWPMLNADGKAPSGNNDSIVLMLLIGERTILMTGDVEKAGEAALLNSKTDLSSDVVKVPHHGSMTSSTEAFVAVTHPRLAIISVGLTSVFGHPNKEVIERWRAGGAEVMTTGTRGTITVSTDGRDLRVESFAPQ